MHATIRATCIGTATLAAVTGALAAPAVAAGPAAPAERSPAPGQVYVVQALPDTSVAIAVDGRWRRTGVEESSILGPFQLAAGEHSLTVTGRNPDWTMDVAVSVSSGRSLDLVLHRPASPQARPVVTTYRAPLHAIAADKGRVLLAHTATVPPADLLLDGEVAFENIANGEFVTADVTAGQHRAELVPTGQRGPAYLGPLSLPVEPRALTSIYAVGRPQDGSMDAVIHRVPLRPSGSAVPDSIKTGSAGLVGPTAGTDAEAPAAATTLGWWALAGTGALAAWLLATGLRRTRRHS
ncbi:MAG: DUF4397 domain-containing protein [Nocardioidaceae bacterium]|nr:DUF4397 domain-containing protein [Nocardioidaceae bacterium]